MRNPVLFSAPGMSRKSPAAVIPTSLPAVDERRHGSGGGGGRGGGTGRGRATPCCSKVGLKRGPWTPEEDELLASFVQREGEGQWRTLPKRAGLLRCGKSCRLRWMNYLRPSIKRGSIAPDEEDIIIRLHRLLGNRWSLIAGRIPGRTDNEIKNYWNTHLSKKLISQGIDPRTHKPFTSSEDPIVAEGRNFTHQSTPAPPIHPPTTENLHSVPPVISIDGSGGAATIPNDHYNFFDGLNPHQGANSAAGWLHEDGLAADGNYYGGHNSTGGVHGMDCCEDEDDAFSLFLDSLINGEGFMQQQNISENGDDLNKEQCNENNPIEMKDSKVRSAATVPGFGLAGFWGSSVDPPSSLEGALHGKFSDNAGKSV